MSDVGEWNAQLYQSALLPLYDPMFFSFAALASVGLYQTVYSYSQLLYRERAEQPYVCYHDQLLSLCAVPLFPPEGEGSSTRYVHVVQADFPEGDAIKPICGKPPDDKIFYNEFSNDLQIFGLEIFGSNWQNAWADFHEILVRHRVDELDSSLLNYMGEAVIPVLQEYILCGYATEEDSLS